MRYYEYIAEYWDEIDSKEASAHGVVYGEDYAEAMKNIEKYYGDTIITIKSSST